jgi:hypothetical protein
MLGRAALIIFVGVIAMGACAPSNALQEKMLDIVLSKKPTGAVNVVVTSTKLQGFSLIIAVRQPWETFECVPGVGASGLPLDMRDAFSSDKDISPSVAAMWTLKDPGDGTRTYATTFSPALLRQQFVGTVPSGIAAIGAVTGGSVGAIVHACLFKRGSKADGTDSIIAAMTDASIIAMSSAEAELMDMRAMIVSPVVVADGKARAKIQTTTYGTCVSDGDIAALPIVHIITTAKARDVPACVSTKDLGNGCKACIQTFDVEAVLQENGSVLDVESKFVEPTKGGRYVAHFVINAPYICMETDTAACVAEIGIDKTAKDIVPVVVDGISLGDTPLVATIISHGESTMQPGTSKARGENGGNTQEMGATFYVGDVTCVEIGGKNKEDGAVSIIDAAIAHPNGQSYTLVKEGVVDDQMARYAAASVQEGKNDGAKLCFQPLTPGETSRTTIRWKADGNTHDDNNNIEKPAWCSDRDICIGTVIINADHKYASHTWHYNSWWAVFIGIVMVIIIGIIICVACFGFGGAHVNVD